jgi:hypothetical protein
MRTDTVDLTPAAELTTARDRLAMLVLPNCAASMFSGHEAFQREKGSPAWWVAAEAYRIADAFLAIRSRVMDAAPKVAAADSTAA